MTCLYEVDVDVEAKRKLASSFPVSTLYLESELIQLMFMHIEKHYNTGWGMFALRSYVKSLKSSINNHKHVSLKISHNIYLKS